SPYSAMVASTKARPGDEVAGWVTTSSDAISGLRRSSRACGMATSLAANHSLSKMMQTSPKSIGVTGSPWMRFAGSTVSMAAAVWGAKISLSRARDRNVSSMPNMTSARGLSLLRTAWVTIDPASPAATTSTAMPVSRVNSANVSSVTPSRNESCDTMRRVSGVSPPSSPHAARMSRATRINALLTGHLLSNGSVDDVSLRRHDPDQVHSVGASAGSLSARFPRAPVTPRLAGRADDQNGVVTTEAERVGDGGAGRPRTGAGDDVDEGDLRVLVAHPDVGWQLLAADRLDDGDGLDRSGSAQRVTGGPLDRRHRRLVLAEDAGDDGALGAVVQLRSG